MDYKNHPRIKEIITQAFEEDVKEGDHTSLATIPADEMGEMYCLVKSDGVIAGVEFAKMAFHHLNPEIKISEKISDGSEVQKGDIVFEVSGKVQDLLVAERLVLNAMQRMSGVATYTNSVVKLIEGLDCKVLDTRKTTPLMRILEKWAVKIGGGHNHRFGLYDMILIKDNHIDFAGGIKNALDYCYNYLKNNDLNLKVEIEVRDLNELQQVIDFGKVDIVLLDNMSAEEMKKAVAMVDGKFLTEASGNITKVNIREKAESGVDRISLGALTHSFTAMDISLKAKK